MFVKLALGIGRLLKAFVNSPVDMMREIPKQLLECERLNACGPRWVCYLGVFLTALLNLALLTFIVLAMVFLVLVFTPLPSVITIPAIVIG